VDISFYHHAIDRKAVTKPDAVSLPYVGLWARAEGMKGEIDCDLSIPVAKRAVQEFLINCQ